MVQDTEKRNKPVGDRDHELLGMGWILTLFIPSMLIHLPAIKNELVIDSVCHEYGAGNHYNIGADYICSYYHLQLGGLY
jgi:hypothetical protein